MRAGGISRLQSRYGLRNALCISISISVSHYGGESFAQVPGHKFPQVHGGLRKYFPNSDPQFLHSFHNCIRPEANLYYVEMTCYLILMWL